MKKNVFYIYPHISHFWYSSFFVQINFFIWHFLFAWKISIDISYTHLLVLNSFSFCKPTKIFISVLMLKPSLGKKCKCIIYMLKHRYVWLSVKFYFCHRNILMSINLKIKLLPSLKKKFLFHFCFWKRSLLGIVLKSTSLSIFKGLSF